MRRASSLCGPRLEKDYNQDKSKTMSTTIQDITLQSTDGVLVARNNGGHLTYPMLHLDRDPMPEDAQGWDRVLIFVDGKTRATISPTIIVLFEENNFSQSLYIQTGGEWSISGVDNSKFQVDQREGVGDARIIVTKVPAFTETGHHISEFAITVHGAVQSVTTIQVYLFLCGASEIVINHWYITLDEVNGYSESLDIPIAGEWTIFGVTSSLIQVTPMSGAGHGLLAITKTMATPGIHSCTFVLISTLEVAIVHVSIDVTVPLEVWNSSGGSSVFSGGTLTVDFTNPSYAYLTIIRDREWTLDGVDTGKIAVSPASGTGSPTDSYRSYATISKASSYQDPAGFTEFYIRSLTQWVKVIVNFGTPITGEFIDPPPGAVGVAAASENIYLYL